MAHDVPCRRGRGRSIRSPATRSLALLPRPRPSAPVLLVVGGLLLGACYGEGGTAPPSGDQGIQATGQLDGQRIAVSRGAPIVIVGDCDPEDGADEDLCIDARTIGGLPLRLVVENRDALVADETVPVGRATCLVGGCDDVTDEVIVRLEVADRTIDVIGGEFDVLRADDRYVADFTLQLPSGDSLRGEFDVTERLPEENPSGVLRSPDPDAGAVTPPSDDPDTDG